MDGSIARGMIRYIVWMMGRTGCHQGMTDSEPNAQQCSTCSHSVLAVQRAPTETEENSTRHASHAHGLDIQQSLPVWMFLIHLQLLNVAVPMTMMVLLAEMTIFGAN